jgi:hypothetical protein
MSDWIVAGFYQSMGRLLIGAVLLGAALALGLYFGGSWLIEHVRITIQ